MAGKEVKKRGRFDPRMFLMFAMPVATVLGGVIRLAKGDWDIDWGFWVIAAAAGIMLLAAWWYWERQRTHAIIRSSLDRPPRGVPVPRQDDQQD